MSKFPVALAVLLAGIPAVSTAVVYRPPVPAPVTKPFEAPAHRWSQGNRGLEYAVQKGDAVRASAAGTVTFAGAVAGEYFVTVAHDDGVRTSYSYLSRIDVRSGQRVPAGTTLGLTSKRFQLGARRGDIYIDPQALMSSGRAHLVPLDAPPAGPSAVD